MDGQQQAEGRARAVHRRRRPRARRWPLPGRRRRRHASASSTSTSWTSATCSGRSSTARPTSGGQARSRRGPPARAQPGREGRDHETALTSENVLELFKDYDIVVDGTDNFPTRYLVNDACVLLGKPNVYGSIFRFEGRRRCSAPRTARATAACTPSRRRPGWCRAAPKAACSACCPASSACIQATETIKLMLGIGGRWSAAC